VQPSITPLIALGLLSIFVGVATAGELKDPKQDRPTPFPLYTKEVPGAKGNGPADTPTLSLYPAPEDKANGAAVVVCPGGGYGGLAEHEGHPIAQWLNSLGVTAVVLKYRLGSAGYRHPIMLNDAARAIRTVRARAAEWKVDPNRIGIIGFSAGGHLASTAATHFDAGNAQAEDPIDRVSSRPDAAILVYPVITMEDPYTHKGSRQNLLGEKPTPELIELLSNEKQITSKTPPCFLVHTTDDSVVPVENSLLFTMACHKAGVPVELHVFEHGPHGFGLGSNSPVLNAPNNVLAAWPVLCANWMKARGFIK
jgi:acetyl esterase/lipase